MIDVTATLLTGCVVVFYRPDAACIERAYYANRTLAEIAGEAGLPLGTVKSRLSAALRRLHGALAEGSAT